MQPYNYKLDVQSPLDGYLRGLDAGDARRRQRINEQREMDILERRKVLEGREDTLFEQSQVDRETQLANDVQDRGVQLPRRGLVGAELGAARDLVDAVGTLRACADEVEVFLLFVKSHYAASRMSFAASMTARMILS